MVFRTTVIKKNNQLLLFNLNEIKILKIKFVEDAIEKSGDRNLNEKFKQLKVNFNDKKILKNIEIDNYYSESTEGVNSKTKKKFDKNKNL